MPEWACQACGQCCRQVGTTLAHGLAAVDEQEQAGHELSPILIELLRFPYGTDSQGACNQLDSTGRCRVYDHRPLICNVQGMYDKYYLDGLTHDEWLQVNEDTCVQLRRTLSIQTT